MADRSKTSDIEIFPFIGLSESFDRHLNYLRSVQRRAIRVLADLFSAAKAIGNDQRVAPGCAHRGQEHSLATRDRNIVMLLFETERTRHPTAACIRQIQIESHFFEQFSFVMKLQNCLVMAMSVKKRPSRQSR